MPAPPKTLHLNDQIEWPALQRTTQKRTAAEFRAYAASITAIQLFNSPSLPYSTWVVAFLDPENIDVRSGRFARRLTVAKLRSRNSGAEILQGLRQLKRGEVGRDVTLPPVAETRSRVGLSQTEFARLLGVSVRTLQEWEQGRRAPSGPARKLLTIAHKNPHALLETAASRLVL